MHRMMHEDLRSAATTISTPRRALPPEIPGITADFSVDLAVLPVDFPAAVSAEAAEEAGKIRIKKR